MRRGIELTVHVAVDFLDAMACAGDPITFRGVETDVRGLDGADGVEQNGSARDLRITYYGNSGLVRGTLQGMVWDRMRYLYPRRTAKRRRRA